jgi:hypothetical protein
VDAFTVIILGGTGAMVVGLILLGLFYPGDGREQLRWSPTRSAEVEAQNEIDDLDQMLAATNARRARRGREPLTEDGIRATLHAEQLERSRTRDEGLAEVELAQMLERKNARRRRRGLPEISREQWLEQLQAEGRL